MRGTYSFGKRLLALLLCIAMVAAYLPGMTMPAKAATNDNTTVDPETLDQWQNYFGQMAPNANNVALTTEYAGGVWTDKSVFDPDNIPGQLTSAKYNGNGISVTDNGENFLIALSAIASNKQIKGYSTIPTDTVFVLDLSSSMRYTDDNGQSAVDELVAATNKAITDLLALNKNNRVAVIVYAGNTNRSFSNAEGITSIILPLDSYTTDQAGTYLQIDPLTVSQRVPGSWNQWQDVPNPNPYALAVYDGVSSTTGGSNAFRTNGFEVSTGTYMQDGVYEAMKLLLASDPVVQEGVQAGTDRLPIMILMTDGEPTMANPDYNGNDARTDLGTSVMHNYNGSTNDIGHRDTIAFVTSLTMAFAKKALASYYGETPLLYTLAYGDTVLNRDEALSILNPSQASTIQNNFWTQFLSGNAVEVYSNNTTVSNSSVASEKLTADDRLYVDKYFSANSDNAMSQAFADIVNEIILQSKYHPTYIETDPNHDGYLTFVDKIGEYMEVTDIKGIIIGDRLFSGAALASKFNAGDLGTIQQPTGLGDNFVWSVQQRLGITDKTVAQALLTSAYNNQQLYYNSDSDFDHYIGWYAKASGSEFEFVDAWYEGATAPADATHIVKSYGFMGDTTVVPGVANTDMMYMTVRISTEIATGQSIVTWKIPAALVPTLTYEVEVELDEDGNIIDVTSLDTESNTAESPIRLVYEVELQKDIYDWNLTEKVDVNYTANKAPGYVFYTNKWSDNAEETTRNTYSHFEPSVQNERYYYTQDTQVLSDDQGTVYTGSKPSGTGYYHSLQVFEKLTDGTLRIHTHYEPISEEALENVVSDGNGGWVIPKGTIHRYYDYEITDKTENITQTMGHSDHPFVEKSGNIYYTYSTQGNNGMLEMTPATGIKLTKTLAEGYANTGDFTFKIEGDIAGAQVVRLTAEGLEASRTPLATDGTLTLKAGQTVYVVGLTAGNYTVSEVIPTGASYKVSGVEVNEQPITEKEAAVTLTAQTITAVEFTNAERGYGNLIISKDVVHPFTNVPQQITDKQFKITVTLTGGDVENTTFAATGIDGINSVTTVNGKFDVYLKDGQSLTVQGLPENTTYTAVETLDSVADAGYRMDINNSITFGTIDAAHPAQAHIVNMYEPDSEDVEKIELTITGTKTVTDPGGTFDWTGKSFQFKLESYDPATQSYTQIGQLAEVTVNGGSYTFGPLTFDTLGTYYYKVSEVIPTEVDQLGSMSYDATTGRLVVHVTDNDVDGKMEIDVQDFTTGQSIAPVGDTITFTKNFVNVHDTQANRVEFTVKKEITGTPGIGVTAAGFLFGLYEAGQSTPTYTMRTVGSDGKATFHIPVVAVGETTYTLQEIHPADADKIPGMNYSNVTYTVVVKAEADPVNSGELIPSVVITDAAGQPVTEPIFENEMALASDSVQFTVKKEMNGTPKTAETFNFTLTETDGSFVTPKAGGVTDTVAITGAGSDLFDAITYTAVGTHYYVVKETPGARPGGMTYDDSEYHITVDVVVNGSALNAIVTINKLGAGTASEIVFTNTYTISGDTSVTISGTKTLTGRPMLNGEFHFQLTQVADAQGTAMANPHTQAVANGPAMGGTAAVTFAPITYTTPGTYYYKISEKAGESNIGVDYDENTYIVTVVVEDDDKGGLTASWSIGAENTFNFANSYTPAAVKTQLHGVKELTGRVLIDGEFEFELYETGSDFSVAGLTAKQTQKNDLHGALLFEPLEYKVEDIGPHYYVVKEKTGIAGGVTYDDSEYHITILVEDNHRGKLETVTSIEKVLADGTRFEVSSMLFHNAYNTGSTQLVLEGTKKLDGRDLEDEFFFDVFEGNTKVTEGANDGNTIVFEPIEYTAAGEHTYIVKERIPAEAVNNVYKGVTYDTREYTVAVEVKDNGDGTLTATPTYVDGPILFENSYSVTSTYQNISGKKVLEGKDIAQNPFTFELYNAAGQFVMNATTDAEGNFVFENVELTEAKTHTFTVKEVIPAAAVGSVLNGMDYDEREYKVTIEVTDNGDGTLTAAAPVYWLNNAPADMEFKNVYSVTGTTQVDISGEKKLTGKPMAAGEFTFELYEGETLVASVTNTAEGKFLFDNVTMTEIGEHTFTVVEKNTGAAGMAYDEREYTVQVTVGDNGTGGLTVENTRITLNGQSAEIVFENTYTPAQITVDLPVEKTVQSLTEQTIGPEGFKFQLVDENGKQLGTVESDKQGKAKFSLVFQAEDIGRTFKAVVSEIDTKKTGVVYSLNKYAVEITISQADSGELISAVTIDGKPAAAMQFVNVYEPAASPVTGDNFYSMLFISLMILSSFGLAAVIVSKKKEEAKESIQ